MGTLLNPTVLPANLTGSIAPLAAGVDNWFSWAPPANPNGSAYYFSTRKPPTNFRNNLHIYLVTGTNPPLTMADLTEVTYQHLGDFHLGYGYEDGASGAFNICGNGACTYYIEVISRDNATPGQMSLFWDVWLPLRLGSCGECNSTKSGLCKVADFNCLSLPQNLTFIPPDNQFSQTVPGALFPSGAYLVRFCTPSGVPLFNPGHGSNVFCQIGTSGADPSLAEFVRFNLTPAPCSFGVFCHPGGEIDMSVVMSCSFGEVSGCFFFINGGNIVFGIYAIDVSTQCQISLVSAGSTGPLGTTWVPGQMINYTCTVTVQNTNLFVATGPFTVGLQANGTTIKSPSAPVAFNLAADASGNATFTFQSNAMDILPATFFFTDCVGNQLAAKQTVNLIESSLSIAVIPPGTVICGAVFAFAPSKMGLSFHNLFSIPISAINVAVTPNTAGGLLFSDPANANPCAGPFATTVWQKNGLGPIPPINFFSSSSILTLNPIYAVIRNNSNQHQQATVQVTIGNPPNPVLSIPASTINVNVN